MGGGSESDDIFQNSFCNSAPSILTPNKPLSLTTTRAIDAHDFLGDFGAGDPFPAERHATTLT
ncbi:unnamed protein product [Lupinus luteus]|uniref:Uncharacterized protein n=1 Tax=Lupinus luteus TaxID=3873 RepID=A0AAV1Y553_LUPLU